ncbi:SAM-dependent RNA methyltransferase [Phakopsora pachyrhizi]|uniref:SAM-dependent RNA methyltransferase n=1 Tax=Phakopsora pachyrhizi TaxID=170000 RepID=A0AAV0B5W6_PHAPC|nr:SAM-dependent RNA methyltransferase [Phakopsora pachyrhizi]CAH7682306.1 SAM-dependent RNA methyltransferase [Phakopsora pachyrhizi]
MGKTYVIEHMEPDEENPDQVVPEWVFLEYYHIVQSILNLKEVDPERSDRLQRGKDDDCSRVFFTNLSLKSSRTLIDQLNRRSSDSFDQAQAAQGRGFLATDSIPQVRGSEEPMVDRCSCVQLSILELIPRIQLSLPRVCLLDPKSEVLLEPKDSEEFDLFLFGGILGDDPPRDRTSQLRVMGFPTRNLGSVQMTTDTAVLVTKLVVERSIRFEDLRWLDRPELVFGKKESVEMPFRYLADPLNQPVMPTGMRDLIRKDLDRSFEF